MQVHDGKWLTTWHTAFWPQVPGQGFWHLFRTHALSDGQSEFMTHSGLHPSYGFPMNSGKQEHDPAPFCSRQTALAPHGDGWQGVGLSWTGSAKNKIKFNFPPFLEFGYYHSLWMLYSRSRKLHNENGLPVYPSGQIHWGVWLTTLQMASVPHVPGQGSLHFWLIQARFDGHSLLLAHSGLQFGGDPWKSGKQEHEGLSPTALHCELGPHGDGAQGLIGACCTGGGGARIKLNFQQLAFVTHPMKTSFNIVECDEMRTIVTLQCCTLNEWVPRHSIWAPADWDMIDYITNRVLATSSWTGIYAFVSAACSVSGTISVCHALWPTALVWITLVFSDAGAHPVITLSIWPTGRWITWVISFNWFYS
ncbi:unnamed protein product [Nesidiocoris tenuis]|uniref:Uncharacterized protein n=1 Tax=Nesidiocoris tenuis TaxID=355587 RepID=A0A6H5GMH9_9HEMI|nr:unnamed protein product [Nesidiocoris tenuis]